MPGLPIQAGLHVYAHCQKDTPGGVALLVINTDRNAPHALTLPVPPRSATRWTPQTCWMSSVRLNGQPLALGADDELPAIAGVPTAAGTLTFAPATITFLAIPEAGNKACR